MDITKKIHLNVTVKSIKLFKENIGVNLCELGLGKALLDTISKAQVTKKINWFSSKLKTIVHKRTPSRK